MCPKEIRHSPIQFSRIEDGQCLTHMNRSITVLVPVNWEQQKPMNHLNNELDLCACLKDLPCKMNVKAKFI
jgi:hypothetical protein